MTLLEADGQLSELAEPHVVRVEVSVVTRITILTLTPTNITILSLT